jgi:hypothetical protein
MVPAVTLGMKFHMASLISQPEAFSQNFFQAADIIR